MRLISEDKGTILCRFLLELNEEEEQSVTPTLQLIQTTNLDIKKVVIDASWKCNDGIKLTVNILLMLATRNTVS